MCFSSSVYKAQQSADPSHYEPEVVEEEVVEEEVLVEEVVVEEVVVEAMPVEEQPIRDIIQIDLLNRTTTMIPSVDPIPSSYTYSDRFIAEKETLQLLRRELPTKTVYTVNIWYGSDTQFGATETPKQGETNASVVGHRLLREEMSIDVPMGFLRLNGRPVQRQTRNGRKNTQQFILDLTDPETWSHTRPLGSFVFSRLRDDHRLCKAQVVVIGTRDQLVPLLTQARPNDNIRGYHLIPITSNGLDRLVGL